MGQSGSMQRIMETLSALNEGKTVCVRAVAQQYEVSERTVRRDFELIREHFGDFMRKEGECYRAYQKVLLEQVLEAADLMTLANIVNLFGLASMENAVSESTRSLLESSMSVYEFKSRPFEVLQNRRAVKKLEHAVKFRKEVELLYRVSQGALTYRYRPYKILFLNENFYLIGENVGKQSVEFLRISMIVDVGESGKTFYADPKIVDFIAGIQTPWADFGRKPINVTLKIRQKVAKYFLLKKFLPSQEVTRILENGDLEVHYTVHDLREVEGLVINWLPHLRILEPKALKQNVARELRSKLKAVEK